MNGKRQPSKCPAKLPGGLMIQAQGVTYAGPIGGRCEKLDSVALL